MSNKIRDADRQMMPYSNRLIIIEIMLQGNI